MMNATLSPAELKKASEDDVKLSAAKEAIIPAELQARLALGVNVRVERVPLSVSTRRTPTATATNVRTRASVTQVTDALAAVTRTATNRAVASLSQQDQLMVARFGFMPSAADIAAIRRRGAKNWILDQLIVTNPASVNFIKLMPRKPTLPQFSTVNYSRIHAMQEMDDRNRVAMLYDAMNGFNDGLSINNGTILLREQMQFEQRIHMQDLVTTDRPALVRLMYFLGMQMLSVNFQMPNESRFFQGMLVHNYMLDTIARNMFGTYPDLVVASFNALAMREQFQINQMKAFNTATQNYGRELLQLHTLGVGNYTQEDIEKVSKMLSANRIWINWGRDSNGYVVGQKYIEAWSMRVGVDPVSHSLDDLTLSNGITVTGENGLSYRDWVMNTPQGPNDVNNSAKISRLIMQKQYELIRKLALHPAAANRFCTKMIESFLGVVEGNAGLTSLRNRMVGAYLASGGHIMTVFRVMINDTLTANTSLSVAMKPWEMVIGVVRAANLFGAANSQNHAMVADEMVRALDTMGHGYYAPATVEGYKDDQAVWLNDAAVLRYVSGLEVLATMATGQISARDFYNNTISGVARTNSINTRILDAANSASVNHDPTLAVLASVMSDFNMRKTARL